MNHALRHKMKVAVAKIGIDSSRLDVLYNLPKIEAWAKEKVPAGCPTFDRREDMYAHLAKAELGGEPVDFLEFGVYEGGSMRQWVGLNEHPESRFVGFDSFEGLPEDWRQIDGRVAADTFDVQGNLPDIDDPRVTFVKGWFQDTVRTYLQTFEPRNRVVLHCDADLYSSTLYTLAECDEILVPGSLVIFDEFSSVLNEFAALRDYCAAYRRDYDVLAATSNYYAQIAIRMR